VMERYLKRGEGERVEREREVQMLKRVEEQCGEDKQEILKRGQGDDGEDEKQKGK